MKHDDGIIKIYTVTNNASNGLMPNMTKTLFRADYFEYRVVGYNRYFRAGGVNVQIDAVRRIWENRSITNDMIRTINGDDYRIIQIQHLYDENNLRVTDLSLEKIKSLEGEINVGNE